MIPLFHDFTDERILVFGGGPVGARKARRFAREAEVIVVAPEFADEDFGGATRRRAAPAPADVGDWIDRFGPALVVAATDDSTVNDAVETVAREQGILVNRADHAGERESHSVVVPATVRDDPVVVAVGTQGRAPAVSAVLREEIESALETAGRRADLVGDLRGSTDVPAERRREALRAVAESGTVRDALAAGETERARTLASDRLAEFE